jgi:hypothetical protein
MKTKNNPQIEQSGNGNSGERYRRQIVERFLHSTERRPTMFEALMKKGGYRVDYLNQKAAGSPDALGFYVRGQLSDQQPYSRDAKHHLYAGMLVIQNQLGSHNLVSVYLDVNEPENLDRPGYFQQIDYFSGL